MNLRESTTYPSYGATSTYSSSSTPRSSTTESSCSGSTTSPSYSSSSSSGSSPCNKRERKKQTISSYSNKEKEMEEPLLSYHHSKFSSSSLPLRPLRDLVFATNVLNNLAVSCIAPFFQRHLEVHYGESYQASGLIFAIFPLIALIASPLGTLLSRWICKYAVWQLGLVISGISTLAFGYSASVPMFAITRGLQGLGFALTTVAGLGLLIERSPDLTADLGRQEMMVGMAFVLSPTIGGFLYTYVGFSSIFLLLSTLFAFTTLAVTASLRSGLLGPLSPSPSCSLLSFLLCQHSRREAASASSSVYEHPNRRKRGQRGIGNDQSAEGILGYICLCLSASGVVGDNEEEEEEMEEGTTTTTTTTTTATSTLTSSLSSSLNHHESCGRPYEWPCMAEEESKYSGQFEEDYLVKNNSSPLLFNNVKRQPPAAAGEGGEGATPRSEERRIAAAAATEKGEGEKGRKQGFVALVRSGVLAAALVVIMTFNTIGFLELAFAGHGRSSLGLGSSGTGLLFSALDIFYSVSGFLIACGCLRKVMGGKCRRIVLIGLVFQMLGFAVIGPLPLPWIDRLIANTPSKEGMLWVTTILACFLMGAGEALAITPSVDLMRAAIPREILEQDPHATDSLAAVMSAATSLGEFLGPLVGGYLMDALPKSSEIGCQELSTLTECSSAYRWSCIMMGVACFTACLICLPLLHAPPSSESSDDDEEEEEATAAASMKASSPSSSSPVAARSTAGTRKVKKERRRTAEASSNATTIRYHDLEEGGLNKQEEEKDEEEEEEEEEDETSSPPSPLLLARTPSSPMGFRDGPKSGRAAGLGLYHHQNRQYLASPAGQREQQRRLLRRQRSLSAPSLPTFLKAQEGRRGKKEEEEEGLLPATNTDNQDSISSSKGGLWNCDYISNRISGPSVLVETSRSRNPLQVEETEEDEGGEQEGQKQEEGVEKKGKGRRKLRIYTHN